MKDLLNPFLPVFMFQMTFFKEQRVFLDAKWDLCSPPNGL